jgi:hypothetical protein
MNRGLDRLCRVYNNLNDEEKGTIIRLAEGLLDNQDLDESVSVIENEYEQLISIL